MGEERSTERIDRFSKAGPFQPEALLGSLAVKGASVVDVGTGGCLWAFEAARQGARLVIAVDRNPERVSQVAGRAAEIGRVLKPGGRLLILELSDGHAHHPRVASPSLRSQLKTQGFEEKKFEERDGWYSIVAHKGALS